MTTATEKVLKRGYKKKQSAKSKQELQSKPQFKHQSNVYNLRHRNQEASVSLPWAEGDATQERKDALSKFRGKKIARSFNRPPKYLPRSMFAMNRARNSLGRFVKTDNNNVVQFKK